jgi:hypothetical protein
MRSLLLLFLLHIYPFSYLSNFSLTNYGMHIAYIFDKPTGSWYDILFYVFVDLKDNFHILKFIVTEVDQWEK